MLVADDQTVRFEASSDEERQNWMETLDECCKEQLEAKSGRKLAAQAKRRMMDRPMSRRWPKFRRQTAGLGSSSLLVLPEAELFGSAWHGAGC